MKTKEELKLYFENGDIPRQEDFWAWQDSYWHKEEKLDKTSLAFPAYEEFVYSSTDNTEIIGLGKRITFPEGIKVIGGFSFIPAGKNFITQVTFPSTLEKIKSSAFALQYLTGTLKIPGSCKIIEAAAFGSYSANLSQLILEEGIETIGIGAFQFNGGKNLKNLYIPNSVKSIGENAFNIPSLQTVSAKAGLDLSKAGIPATATITYR
ncbi:leucine-rich repeat domain-containing protein [Chryseobacterium tructae]|uniref:Leucine-rich repeat domain-containing protein n=1 Tax=Chryseobacterium tructae TaxID=1037380 RepID=A0ABV7XRB5_9FLAO|nr:leucine-rich repeat domain-containing protein [Chryseobacterium tructae]MDN3695348.1 leucine-rich repeat domain-containing protein [Chryseobacterium tructae]